MPERIRSKAIVQHGQKLVEEDVTLPELKDHEILIKVHHAALNPTDGMVEPPSFMRATIADFYSIGF